MLEPSCVGMWLWIDRSIYGGCLNVNSRFHYCCLFILVMVTRPCKTDGSVLELQFHDKTPQRYEMKARGRNLILGRSHIRRSHFFFEKDGKPQDFQNAIVDARTAPQGKLVIWLMGHSTPLFERLSSYGLHAIQVHYANGWFGKFREKDCAGR